MSEITKSLGRISSVKFGHVGYQDAMLGIQFCFDCKGSGTCTDKSTWDPEIVECASYCKWTEADRDKSFAEIMRYISKLLKDAKVDDVSKLLNKPVEVTWQNSMLKEWRILTEVL